MEPHYRVRIYLLTALILFGFGSLLTRLHSFQIERKEHFQAQVPGAADHPDGQFTFADPFSRV